MKTLITVLNWKTYEMTKECIHSLLTMDGDSFEILIIDNGSQDGSAEYLRQAFPKIPLIANASNLGFAAGSNIGMKLALEQGADFVLLVNNDTVVKPDLLAELLAESERRPDAGMVSPKIYYADHPDRIWWAGGTFSLWQGVPRHLGWKEKERGQYETARVIDWATGCVVLLRCDALRNPVCSTIKCSPMPKIWIFRYACGGSVGRCVTRPRPSCGTRKVSLPAETWVNMYATLSQSEIFSGLCTSTPGGCSG